MHGGEELLGGVLGLDQGDEPQWGLPLVTDKLNPNGRSEHPCPRNVPRLAEGLSLRFSGTGSVDAGTTSRRTLAWDDRTPKYRVRCLLGDGSRAARRAMKARGSRFTDDVPSGFGLARPAPASRGFTAPFIIGPRLFELQPGVAVVEDLEAVVGNWWAEDVLAQGESAVLVVGGDLGRGVKVERVGLRAQGGALLQGRKRGADKFKKYDSNHLAVDGRGQRAHATCVRDREAARLHVVCNPGTRLRTPSLRIVLRASCCGVWLHSSGRLPELFGQANVGGRCNCGPRWIAHFHPRVRRPGHFLLVKGLRTFTRAVVDR